MANFILEFIGLIIMSSLFLAFVLLRDLGEATNGLRRLLPVHVLTKRGTFNYADFCLWTLQMPS